MAYLYSGIWGQWECMCKMYKECQLTDEKNNN
jgi:hypothetical protein